jgi:hypothetical protein
LELLNPHALPRAAGARAPGIVSGRDYGPEQRTFAHSDENPDGLDHEAAARIAWECDMARRIVETLQLYYPGHAWEVTCDKRHGGAQLRIAVLMTGDHCYFMRFSDIDGANSFDRVVRNAGGELLERFNIPRAGFQLASWMEARPKAVFHTNQRMPGE